MDKRGPHIRTGRCVHCGEQIDSEYGCRYAKEHGTMDLPEGQTCGNCVHMPRCRWLIGAMESDQRCDWFPIVFSAKPITN